MLNIVFTCDSWALRGQNALSAVINYSSMGLLLCPLARLYPFRAQASSPVEPRIVGMEKTKSPSGSLETMASGVSPIFTPWLHSRLEHFGAYWL